MANEQSEPVWNAGIKRNPFESVLMKGMNLEHIKQESQSKGEKHVIKKARSLPTGNIIPQRRRS